MKKGKVLYAKVLHDYKPQEPGELRLHAGDTIKDVTRLAKGWCKVKDQNPIAELHIIVYTGELEWKVWFLS